MTRRLSIILFLFYFTHSSSFAQNKLKIWLGDGMDTLFDAGVMKRGDINSDYSLFEFLGYRSYWHQSTDETNNTNYNRMGLILHAKSSEQFNVRAEVALGKDDDTCFIYYGAMVEKITTGRSAALSILNLFSKKADKVPQAAPATYITGIHFEGKFLLKNDSVSFLYDKSNKQGYRPDSRLWWGSDSLQLQGAMIGIRKKNKLKKNDMGVLLKKGEMIIAGMDQYNQPNSIYIRKNIPEEEKLMAAAYLYMIACYR